VAVWNRRLAWITLPMFLLSTAAYYLPLWEITPGLKPYAIPLSLVFILLFFTHSLFSVYLFGLPKPRANIRVIHLYIGYLLFIFTLISNSIIGIEPYHIVAYVVMWIFLLAHISLSIRFFWLRSVKRRPAPELKFYTGGGIIRDASPEEQPK
jgi:hypothetical protein